MKHTFAICAYKASPYLEACIRSLLAQTVPSDIILCTSTPNDYIYQVADKYQIDVYVNEAGGNISADWNFAYEKSMTELVTIAHQDDLYLKDYTQTLLSMYEKYPDMSLFTAASVTLKKGKLISFGSVEIVKKLLRLPLRFRNQADKTGIKMLALRFGNPVICPSCAYNKKLCGENLFISDYSFVLDWEVLIKLAKKPGRFVLVEKPMIMYRVHDGAETMAAIVDHRREKEEAEVFDQLLPKPISAIVKKMYRRSYGAYS